MGISEGKGCGRFQNDNRAMASSPLQFSSEICNSYGLCNHDSIIKSCPLRRPYGTVVLSRTVTVSWYNWSWYQPTHWCIRQMKWLTWTVGKVIVSVGALVTVESIIVRLARTLSTSDFTHLTLRAVHMTLAWHTAGVAVVAHVAPTTTQSDTTFHATHWRYVAQHIKFHCQQWQLPQCQPQTTENVNYTRYKQWYSLWIGFWSVITA